MDIHFDTERNMLINLRIFRHIALYDAGRAKVQIHKLA